MHRIILLTVLTLTAAALTRAETLLDRHDSSLDRLWVVSTRSLTSDACRAPLDAPNLCIHQLDRCGSSNRSDCNSLLQSLSSDRQVLIHVHGNRMNPDDAIERGLFVYKNTVAYANASPIDFIVFSWPSEQTGILLKDGREKAERTDAEGLYLAWLLREFAARNVRVTLLGFSFGGRVATGAVHALAGGKLGGRGLPGEHVQGANISVGLIAPALEDDWLRKGSYHGMASLNMNQLSVLYNRRDAVLRRYWLLDAVRGSMALGYTGPKGIAPRFDGTSVPVMARDCSTSLGIRHDEQQYYSQDCRAGKQLAKLLESSY